MPRFKSLASSSNLCSYPKVRSDQLIRATEDWEKSREVFWTHFSFIAIKSWNEMSSNPLVRSLIVKSSKLALLMTLCMTAAPAFAAGTDTSDDTPLGKVVQATLLPTRVAGLGAGCVVGTPVATTREIVKSYLSFTPQVADKIGGKDFAPSCVVATVFTAPAAVLVGTALGIYHGNKNGIVHGFNEPFSPASFSVTKEYEGD
jgi:hypothetical protein